MAGSVAFLLDVLLLGSSFQEKEKLVVCNRLAVLYIVTRTEKHKAIICVELCKLLVAVFHLHKDDLSADLLFSDEKPPFSQGKQRLPRNQIAIFNKVVLADLRDKKCRNRISTSFKVELCETLNALTLCCTHVVGMEYNGLVRKRKISDKPPRIIIENKMRDRHFG